MADNLPYMMAYGNISKGLTKIKEAATPPRFTQDFLATKLDLSGGSAKPLIPFLKKTGFLGSDGVPTELYKRFRNPSETGGAAAEALRHGYSPLYEINEYIHDVSDTKLSGAIVQATGFEPNSSTVKAVVGSFKALKEFASFDDAPRAESGAEDGEVTGEIIDTPAATVSKKGFTLSYTINLNLPATSDIAVFNAIFKSLKENLLK